MSTGSRINRKALNRRGEKYVKFTLTSTQILALNGTPVTVLAAPPATLVNIVDCIYATVPAQTTAYTIGSNTGIDFKYTSSSGVVAANIPTTGFIDGTTGGASYADASASVIPVAGAVIVAQAKTANVTLGTGAITGRIYFRTVPALV